MTYLMNVHTGSVYTESELWESFENSTPEEWGGESFEDGVRDFVEVVENREGELGYDENYGDWRPADDEELPANSASDDSGDLDQWDPEICPECQGEDFNLIDTYTAYASDLDYDDPDVEPDTVFTILRFVCECGCDFKVIEETNEVVSINHLD